jgi:DNA-binding CsgD family transcriptional regulator
VADEVATGDYPTASFFRAEILLGDAWAAAAERTLTQARELVLRAVDAAQERTSVLQTALASYDALRLGAADGAGACLEAVADARQGDLIEACVEDTSARASGDPAQIERSAGKLARLGACLWAAEAELAAAAGYHELGRDASSRAAAGRAALLVARCEGASTPGLQVAGPAQELTGREREIALLAAGGASNREIASRLVVSVRTVENHLHAVYRKLGVSSRTQLPHLIRQGE